MLCFFRFPFLKESIIFSSDADIADETRFYKRESIENRLEIIPANYKLVSKKDKYCLSDKTAEIMYLCHHNPLLKPPNLSQIQTDNFRPKMEEFAHFMPHIISFGSNLPKNIPNHYPELYSHKRIFSGYCLAFGSLFRRLEPI